MDEKQFNEMMHALRKSYEPDKGDQDRVYQSVIAAPILPTDALGHSTARMVYVLKGGGALIVTAGIIAATYFSFTRAEDVQSANNEAPIHSPTSLDPETQSKPTQSVFSSSSRDLNANQPSASTPAAYTDVHLTTPDIESNHTAGTASKHHTSRTRSVKKNVVHTDFTSTAHSTLSDELRLISIASKQINTGQFAAAMETLAQHRKQFSTGMMVQERNGLEIIALCKQGKSNTAGEKYRQFKMRTPDAPISIRIEKTCAFE